MQKKPKSFENTLKKLQNKMAQSGEHLSSLASRTTWRDSHVMGGGGLYFLGV